MKVLLGALVVLCLYFRVPLFLANTKYCVASAACGLSVSVWAALALKVVQQLRGYQH